jgi:hypothetical protein
VGRNSGRPVAKCPTVLNVRISRQASRSSRARPRNERLELELRSREVRGPILGMDAGYLK